MSIVRPDAVPEPVPAQTEVEVRAPLPGGMAAADFRDSEGGLFSGPASLLPEIEAASSEPPVRSLFAPRGLFRP